MSNSCLVKNQILSACLGSQVWEKNSASIWTFKSENNMEGKLVELKVKRRATDARLGRGSRIRLCTNLWIMKIWLYWNTESWQQRATRASFTHVLIVLIFIVHKTFPIQHINKKSKNLYIGHLLIAFLCSYRDRAIYLRRMCTMFSKDDTAGFSKERACMHIADTQTDNRTGHICLSFICQRNWKSSISQTQRKTDRETEETPWLKVAVHFSYLSLHPKMQGFQEGKGSNQGEISSLQFYRLRQGV